MIPYPRYIFSRLQESSMAVHSPKYCFRGNMIECNGRFSIASFVYQRVTLTLGSEHLLARYSLVLTRILDNNLCELGIKIYIYTHL